MKTEEEIKKLRRDLRSEVRVLAKRFYALTDPDEGEYIAHQEMLKCREIIVLDWVLDEKVEADFKIKERDLLKLIPGREK